MKVFRFIFSVVVWTSLAAAQKEKACPSFPNVDNAELDGERKDSYNHGTILKYNCRPGYIKLGRLLRICEDGKWIIANLQVICKSKPCGHPGDAQSGSFQLTKGDDFVFGSRVEYTCDEGYQMVSQRNFRDCLADGWSNDVPHCEVRTCEPVRPPQNGKIIMSGIYEADQEFPFGHVLQFECDESYMLNGGKDIHCLADGRWSAPVPKCERITCKPPKINDGALSSDKQIFEKGERVEYICYRGYRPSGRPDIECTRFGWSPEPRCTEIVCDQPELHNGEYNPKRTLYREDDEVTFSCKTDYQTEKGERGGKSKCTLNGWQPVMKCLEKPCDLPKIPNGYIHSYYVNRRSQSVPIGDTIYIYCYEDYRTPDGLSSRSIKCTPQGWQPTPVCYKPCIFPNTYTIERIRPHYGSYRYKQQVQYTCQHGHLTPQGTAEDEVTCLENGWSIEPSCKKPCTLPDILHGTITTRKKDFVFHDKLQYKCDDGYRNEGGKSRGETECLKTGWHPEPKCSPIEPESCTLSEIPHGWTSSIKHEFALHDKLHYHCHNGYRTEDGKPEGDTECLQTGWFPKPECSTKVPVDTGLTCEEPKIENGKTNTISEGLVEFSCEPGFVLHGSKIIQCQSFGWHPQPPECKEITCELPKIENGKTNTISKGLVEFSCQTGFALHGSKIIQCHFIGWHPEPPVCKEYTCGNPPEIMSGIYSPQKDSYKIGENVTYSCAEEYLALFGNATITCTADGWPLAPFCQDQRKTCELPAGIDLENVKESKNEYNYAEEINYACSPPSENTGSTKSECIGGEWIPQPSCINPRKTCGPPTEIPNGRIRQTRNKSVYKHNDKVMYECLQGSFRDGSKFFSRTCTGGSWATVPECIIKQCPPPPPELPNSEPLGESTDYGNGTTIQYQCRAAYELEGPKEVTCNNGKWTSLPQCIEMQCVPPRIDNGDIEGFTYNTVYTEGSTLIYRCKTGYQQRGPTEIKCISKKWSHQPKCTEKQCGTPSIQNGDIDGFTDKTVYKNGDKLTYRCKRGYEQTGPADITCTSGEWSPQPNCKDIQCEPPRIENGDIEGFTYKSVYEKGDKLTYRCQRGYERTGPEDITCTRGEWSPQPNCIVPDKSWKCGLPPPINNGDTEDITKPSYDHGSSVTYKCKTKYKLVGNSKVFCWTGKWELPPTCLEACTITQDRMRENNLELRYGATRKLYAEHDEPTEFQCKSGFWSTDPMRVKCNNGTLPYPKCT